MFTPSLPRLPFIFGLVLYAASNALSSATANAKTHEVAMTAVETDVVSLSLKDDVSQAVMRPVGAAGYDYTYVIMPMRI